MRGVSNSPWLAMLMSTPSPTLAPAHSATTAPMTASVTPTRSPPKITGSADGTSSSRVRWERAGAERAQHLVEQRVGGADADHGGDRDREEDDERADHDARQQSAAEPDVQQRRQGQDRHRLGGDDVRREDPLDDARTCRARCPIRIAVVAPNAKPRTTSSSVVATCSHSTPEPMARAARSSDDLRRRQDELGVAADHGHELPGRQEGGEAEQARSRCASRRPPTARPTGAARARGPRVSASRTSAASAAARGSPRQLGRPRSRQVDLDDPRHPARARRHDHHPVGQASPPRSRCG